MSNVRNRVLVVEDEIIIAMDLEMSLSEFGWSVVGPVGRVEEALELIDKNRIDIAILDYNLVGGTSELVALKLIELKIAVIFLSGDSLSNRSEALSAIPIQSKPIDFVRLNEALEELLGSS